LPVIVSLLALVALIATEPFSTAAE